MGPVRPVLEFLSCWEVTWTLLFGGCDKRLVSESLRSIYPEHLDKNFSRFRN
jgi:hypothetical protein